MTFFGVKTANRFKIAFTEAQEKDIRGKVYQAGLDKMSHMLISLLNGEIARTYKVANQVSSNFKIHMVLGFLGL